MSHGTLPPRYDLHLYRGDDYQRRFIVRGVDLTGWTARAQVKGTGSPHDLTVTVEPDAIVVTVVPADYATLTPGAWDLQAVYPNGLVRTLVTGAVTITGDVTT